MLLKGVLKPSPYGILDILDVTKHFSYCCLLLKVLLYLCIAGELITEYCNPVFLVYCFVFSPQQALLDSKVHPRNRNPHLFTFSDSPYPIIMFNQRDKNQWKEYHMLAKQKGRAYGQGKLLPVMIRRQGKCGKGWDRQRIELFRIGWIPRIYAQRWEKVLGMALNEKIWANLYFK